MCRPLALIAAYGLAAIATPLLAQTTARCEQPIYEIDFDGTVLSGSKSELLRAAQHGEPMRVGWDLDFDGDKKSDLSHWSDARFISILGTEVATQVQSIHRQIPEIESGNVKLPEAYTQWHGLLDSQGVLQGRFESSNKVFRDQVRSAWCSALPEKLSWRLIYKHDVNGHRLYGKKTALLEAVRSGQAIQIGWGLLRKIEGVERSIEHTISPVFVSIIDNKEVVAQMPEHIAQKSYWDSDNSLFKDGAVLWRGLATTEGRFDAIWVNRATGKTVRRSPQRAAFSWYAQGTTVNSSSLAIKNGVIADQARIKERVP